MTAAEGDLVLTNRRRTGSMTGTGSSKFRRGGSRPARRLSTGLLIGALALGCLGCENDQDRWTRVVSSAERVVAFAVTPRDSVDVAVSSDGVRFERSELDPSARLVVDAIDTGEAVFVITGSFDGSPNRLLVSTDGADWAQVPTPAPFHGLAHSDDAIVALGRHGLDFHGIYRSTDGYKWDFVHRLYAWSYLAFTGEEFVASDGRASILTSPDGEVWRSRSHGVSEAYARFSDWVSVGDEAFAFVEISDSAAAALPRTATSPPMRRTGFRCTLRAEEEASFEWLGDDRPVPHRLGAFGDEFLAIVDGDLSRMADPRDHSFETLGISTVIADFAVLGERVVVVGGSKIRWSDGLDAFVDAQIE